MGFLDNIKSSPQKNIVYLSITPGVGIELIQLDINSNIIKNYAVRELTYNESLRDIVDYENFKNAVSSMYEQLKINPKTQVVVNLPIVSFGIKQFGLIVPDDAITGALKNEVETLYIFQKSESILDWIDLPKINTEEAEERSVAYSAIQASVIENLSQKLNELGSTLVWVENSLSCTFRALKHIGIISEQIASDIQWNLLIMSSKGYSLVSMSGKNVVAYQEEAIAISSLDEDEIYDTIAENIQIAMLSYPANYLCIVSDTDYISAQALASRLNIEGKVDYIENNSFKSQEFMPVGLDVIQNDALKISLESIGCALTSYSDFPLKFNYLGQNNILTSEPTCTIPIGEHEYTLTKSQALKLAAVIAGVLIIIFYGLSMFLPSFADTKEAKIQELQTKIDELNSQLKDIKGEGDLANFDLKREVEMGMKANRAKLMNFVAQGENIPEDVWLTYFITKDNGLVDIKGGAKDVSSVYTFFKSLRDSLNSTGSKLKLQKLEMASKSVDAAVAGLGANYIFEITNMTTEQLNRIANPKSEDDENSSNGDSEQSNSSDSVPQEGLIDDQPIE